MVLYINMQVTFENIVHPFQTGETVLPPGVSLETGVVALTSPRKLERALEKVAADDVLSDFAEDSLLEVHEGQDKPEENAPNKNREALSDIVKCERIGYQLESPVVLANSVGAEVRRLGKRGRVGTLLASTALFSIVGFVPLATEMPHSQHMPGTVAREGHATADSEDEAWAKTLREADITMGAMMTTAGAFAGGVAGSMLTGRFARRKATKMIKTAEQSVTA